MAKQSTRGERGSRAPAGRSRGSGRASGSSGWHVSPSQWSWIIGLVLLGLALLTFLMLITPNRGDVSAWWLGVLSHSFGWGLYVIPLILAAGGLWALTRHSATPIALPWPRVAGLGILFIATLALIHQFVHDPVLSLDQGQGGGYLGYWLSRGLSGALGWGGALVVLVILEGMGLVLAFELSLAEVVEDTVAWVRHVGLWLRATLRAWQLRRETPSQPELRLPRGTLPSPFPPADASSDAEGLPAHSLPWQGARPEPTLPIHAPQGPTEPALATDALQGAPHRWMLPNAPEMLAETIEKQMSLPDIRAKTHVIEETLNSLGVPVTVVEVNPGPVVTQFGLEPGYVERRDRQGRTKRVKVKVSRIAALANDLALALAASPIRIEAPVPGKGIVGIEVPNNESSTVGLRGVLESEQFAALGPAPLAVGLGRDVSGTPVVDDLAKLPHLLIAGATGSGKSVCINALIACLLCRNTPDDLRLLMVDPKRVELSGYNGIPHLIAPVVVDTERVVSVLTGVTREMDRRYKVFAGVGTRNLEAYNRLAAARGDPHMPYIVTFIDELADLMLVAPDEVERLICRIAQLARATGIHLVIATQRPSVDVVTGLIKANFPARVAFLVSSQVDSRVIIDVPGAEKLLGRGDALYMAPDSPKLLRMQGCWVSDDEINRIVGFWRSQNASAAANEPGEHGAPMVQPSLWSESAGKLAGSDRIGTVDYLAGGPGAESEGGEDDPLLDEAIAIVRDEGKASVSFLQRRLRIGYTRAARLVDLLETRGIIGGATGSSRPREVLPPGPDKPASDTNMNNKDDRKEAPSKRVER